MVLYGIRDHQIPSYIYGMLLQYSRYNMVDKSKGETTTTTGSNEVTNLYDTVEQNSIRIVDEFTKTAIYTIDL